MQHRGDLGLALQVHHRGLRGEPTVQLAQIHGAVLLQSGEDVEVAILSGRFEVAEREARDPARGASAAQRHVRAVAEPAHPRADVRGLDVLLLDGPEQQALIHLAEGKVGINQHIEASVGFLDLLQPLLASAAGRQRVLRLHIGVQARIDRHHGDAPHVLPLQVRDLRPGVRDRGPLSADSTGRQRGLAVYAADEEILSINVHVQDGEDDAVGLPVEKLVDGALLFEPPDEGLDLLRQL
mmetsp:Transcript_101359/g.292080  ORF Transcript_101359/g.292080 Transcript_101359/m.292080 type:complete len:239 (+) Transcript_101359:357-1073(+)